MTRPVETRATDAAPEPLSEETLETSKLLLELIHAGYATRRADAATTPSGVEGEADAHPAASPHAIRAAIHVYQHGQRTIGELADGLGISYGWASRVVSELEASGLVRRSTDPADRRLVHVTLTAEAMAMVEDAYRWRGDAVARALATLDEPGRLAVRTFLRNVIDELGEAGRARGREP